MRLAVVPDSRLLRMSSLMPTAFGFFFVPALVAMPLTCSVCVGSAFWATATPLRASDAATPAAIVRDLRKRGSPPEGGTGSGT